MKKLTTEGEALASDFELYTDMYGGCSCHVNPPCRHCTHEGHPECLANSPMLWNSVSTIKAGDKWFASYDMLKTADTVLIGSGKTEQEAVGNLPARELL